MDYFCISAWIGIGPEMLIFFKSSILRWLVEGVSTRVFLMEISPDTRDIQGRGGIIRKEINIFKTPSLLLDGGKKIRLILMTMSSPNYVVNYG